MRRLQSSIYQTYSLAHGKNSTNDLSQRSLLKDSYNRNDEELHNSYYDCQRAGAPRKNVNHQSGGKPGETRIRRNSMKCGCSAKLSCKTVCMKIPGRTDEKAVLVTS